MSMQITRPGNDEYSEFHKGYLQAVEHEQDGLGALERQNAAIERLRLLTTEQAGHRYAEGKWNVKEMVGHLSDTERVMAYRLLRIARGDQTPLPGFDEKVFAAASNADRREVADLAEEMACVRAATLALVRSLDPSVLPLRGIVNEWPLSVRGLVFIIAGHFAHHLRVLRERYGVELQ
ncbi:MAG: DinB family protein [Acidobacteriota bacterium]